VAEEEAEAIEFGRLQALKRAKKKSYIIRGGLAAAALIILGLTFWNPGNKNFEPTTGLSAQFSGFEWNMYQGGPALSGSRDLNQLAFLDFCLIFDCISNPNSNAGGIVWRYKANGAISSSPAVTEEAVYVSTDDRRILALELETGNLIWEYSAEAPTDSSPAIAGDLLYVALREGKFVALDRNNGTVVWDFQSSEPFFSSPSIHNGIAYIGSGEKIFYAFDALTGEQIWEYDAGSRIANAGAVNEDVVAFTTQNNVVHIVDAFSGNLRLDYPIGSSFSAPAMDGKLLFVSDLDGVVRALDWTKIQYPMEKMARRFRMTMFLWGFEDTPPTMKGFVWKFRNPREVFQNTPTIANGMVYVPSLYGRIYKLSASTGDKQWIYTTEGTVSESVSVVGDLMLAGDSTGKVHGVDVKTGKKIWEIQLDGRISSTPVVSAEMLFVATQNGSLYAIK
jgi:outer membrane protein assembly factor BamB